ncbi:MAG: phosphate ABC transporter substrate-binding/OmpA family protein [Hyphomicrobium sp.]
MVFKKVRYLGAAAVLAGSTLTALPAGSAPGDGVRVDASKPDDVVFRLRDSDIEVLGALKSFDGTSYVVETRSFGVLSLEAARFDCQGQRCKEVTAIAETAAAESSFSIVSGDDRPVSRFSIQGSDTLGRELMPALIREYARSIGGSVRQLVGSRADETQFSVMGADRAVVSVIDVARAAPAAALKSVAAGSAAIAMSNRPIRQDEFAELAQRSSGDSGGRLENVVALDGVAVIVSPANGARALSLDKLAQIFSGRITDWSGVGLPAGRISIYLGQDAAGASDAFANVVLAPAGLTLAQNVVRLNTESEVSDAVARDPNGIGIASYAFLNNARAVDVEGSCGLTWRPSEFSIKAEEYPLSRRLYLYTAGTGKLAEADRLVKFASSDAAQTTIAASQFMDQSVIFEPYGSQVSNVESWLAKSGASPFELALGRNLLISVKDAQRLSLTFRFAPGSARLDAKAQQDIVRLVGLLTKPEFKGKSVMLTGFTDSVGSARANAVLAKRRANQVRDSILAAAPAGSIDPARLIVDGFGTASPVACNDTAESMNRNRRVEVWLRDQPPPPRLAIADPETDSPRVPPRRKKRLR